MFHTVEGSRNISGLKYVCFKDTVHLPGLYLAEVDAHILHQQHSYLISN